MSDQGTSRAGAIRLHLPTAALLSVVLGMSGCQSPLDAGRDSTVRAAVLDAHREFLATVTEAKVVELDREPSDVEAGLTNEQREELDQLSGMSAYEDQPAAPGKDLLGTDDTPTVALTLQRAIRMAVDNNLDLHTARLTPRIGEQQLLQADAAFDATLFANVQWNDQDTPGPASGAVPGLSGDRQSETLTLNTGIRQPLKATGGTIQLETALNRFNDDPSVQGVAPFYDADVLLTLNQPLLRNFGRTVATAQIELAENARDAAVFELRASTINLVDAVVQAYWQVLFARQQLLIQANLLERTIEDRDRIQDRLEFDASQVQFTEANSFVELRRADLIRARQAWRGTSDQLKRLINAEDLPLTDETLIVPADSPLDAPLSFSLLDTVTTALQERPDLRSAEFAIDDALIRQRVADNNKLPLLDLVASVGLGGVGIEDGQDAYDELSEGDYLDWLVGLDFEYPLGNRGPEAQFEQRVLERRQAVLDYRRLAQDVVLEVKDALRDLVLQYELIGATRAARRAAADNLRAIQAQEDAGTALTPEFLNLKLDAQQRLANAETQEADALTGYMTAIAELYRTQGTLLEQMGIEFEDPLADDDA
ncbi:MAG: TolC family protein [Planctomycetota bacterium]